MQRLILISGEIRKFCGAQTKDVLHTRLNMESIAEKFVPVTIDKMDETLGREVARTIHTVTIIPCTSQVLFDFLTRDKLSDPA